MEINAIHKQFHQTLKQFIRSRVKHTDDAEDILQETFIKLSFNLQALKNTEKLQSWIFTIARNAITDYYRKKNKLSGHAEIHEHLSDTIAEEKESDTTKGLETCIRAYINQLPEGYREIILDSEIKGIKQKDLVEKYGIGYPGIRSRVQRGRKMIKEMFLNCCRIEQDKRGNILQAQKRNPDSDSCHTCP